MLKLALAAVACLSFLGCCASAQAIPTTSNDQARLELPVELSYTAVPAVAAAMPVAYSQEPEPTYPWSLAGYYSLKRGEWSLVAANNFDTLWADLGGRKGLNVELIGFAGGNAETMLLGGGIGLTVPLHPRIRLGAYIAIAKNETSFEDFFKSLNGFEIGGAFQIEYQVRF